MRGDKKYHHETPTLLQGVDDLFAVEAAVFYEDFASVLSGNDYPG